MADMRLPALYRVSAYSGNEDWYLLVKAESPMAALAHAINQKTWDVLRGVTVAIEVNFYDLMAHEALAAAIVEGSSPATIEGD